MLAYIMSFRQKKGFKCEILESLGCDLCHWNLQYDYLKLFPFSRMMIILCLLPCMKDITA